MDTTQRLQELFLRYQQRRCSPAEIEELIHLLQEADAEEKLSGPMQALWAVFSTHSTEYQVDWDSMYSRVRQVEADLSSLHQQRSDTRRQIKFMHRRYGIAAAVLIALLIPASWWALSRKTIVAPPTAATSSFSAKSQLADRPETERRRILHLPDGSTVILNRNSRLAYTPGLTGAAREVTLVGEAWFDITHVAGRPFLVHTKSLTTRVLGTAFNIKAWPSDRSIEVTVQEGKVQVLKSDSSLGLLTAAQQMSVDERTDHVAKIKKVALAPVLAWRPEEVHFDDLTMEEAAKQITQRFGLSVEFKNPALKHCRVTATFYEDDGLDEIMTVLCGISQSSYTIGEHSVTIDGQGCN